MVDVRGDVLRPPHGTTPAAVKSNPHENREIQQFQTCLFSIFKTFWETQFLISLNDYSSQGGMLTQTKKNWVVSMTSLRLFSMWPIRGLCIRLMSKSRILFIHNLFSAIIPGNFLEMIMLISQIGTMTQTRMG